MTDTVAADATKVGAAPAAPRPSARAKTAKPAAAEASAQAAAVAPAAPTSDATGDAKYVWYDLRGADSRPGLVDELLATVARVRGGGVVVEDDQVKAVPAGLKKVKLLAGTPSDEELARLRATYDLLILDADVAEGNWFAENRSRLGIPVGARVDVVDPPTLQRAVALTHKVPLLLVTFKDDTKIPLEIVLADAQNHGCEVVMGVRDSVEANVVFGVLEIGATGVMAPARDLSAVYALDEVVVAAQRTHAQHLSTLTIVRTRNVGMGERACLDFTSYMGLDEGVLIGCFSGGGILATSETHKLPYMPTRPFRVNAGALQMYVLAPDNQTWYLSDLRAGMEVLAVNTAGGARPVTVGRVKIERRPMLHIVAEAPDGTLVHSIMQEDWHVRVFGVDGKPANITNLRPGHEVLGYTTPPGRHVGVKVSELIIEQ